MSVMRRCVIRDRVLNLLVLIMVLIMVIKDIKVVRSGDPVLRRSSPVHHHSVPGVLLLLCRLLLCRHGRRYVGLV